MMEPNLDELTKKVDMAEKNKGEAPEKSATTSPYRFRNMYEAEESIGRLLNRCVDWLSTPQYRYTKLKKVSVYLQPVPSDTADIVDAYARRMGVEG